MRSPILLFVNVAAVLSLLSGCDRERKVSAASVAPVNIEIAPDPTVVKPPHPEQFALVEAQARSVHNDLLVNGVVSPDVSRTVPVNLMSAGRVLEIRARLGDQVEKGQLLLRVQSPDLAGAIADYQKALADEILARRSLERADVLFRHGALAEKDKQAAEDVETKAKVDVHNSEERIRILGGNVEQLSPVVDVYAPVAGTIVEQNTTGAAAVKSLDNSPNLFTIADLSNVWVLCDVYENDLAHVRLGDFAEVRLNAYPDRVLRGRVSNIGSILDAATRTAKVRLELSNPQGLLRPGMFATATFVSQAAQARVVLPSSAILRLHDRDWVFRPLDGVKFKLLEIQAGHAADDGSQQVLAGLKPGDRVVANALQFSSAVEK